MISRETLQFHHDKHHRSYVEKLNKLILGTEFENSPLDEIVMKSSGALYDQAAQHWNHSFYWNSLSPKSPPLAENAPLHRALNKKFGSSEKFEIDFEKKGAGLFGSGWLWLAADPQGALELLVTKDAGNPIRSGLQPLFVCDLWEHAFYIDYRNDRPKYISEFYKLIDWEFAEQNYFNLTTDK